MLEGLSPVHLILVLVIALIVVGPGKLPEVGGAIGKSIREFRKAASGDERPAASPPTAPAQATASAAAAPAPAAPPPPPPPPVALPSETVAESGPGAAAPPATAQDAPTTPPAE